MNEFNRTKLLLILTVAIAFTIVNIIKDNNWVGYLLSLVIFPLITWLIIELIIKRNKK